MSGEKNKNQYNRMVDEYRDILSQKYKNSNKYIIEIKGAQAALKRMELERVGASINDLRKILIDARKDAVCYLLMELGEFLGDQQMVKSSKAARSFLSWGIKHVVTKLRDLGLEITQQEISEMTIDSCLTRIEKLKKEKDELEFKYGVTYGTEQQQPVRII